MSKLKKIFIIIILLTVAPLLKGCMPHTVGSTEVGVKVNKFSILGKKGVEDNSFGPGTYFFFPIINDWYLFDTRIQNLEMTIDRESGDIRARDDLLFKTIDGNDISLDVIISYRIDFTKAPDILRDIAINNEQLKINIVRIIARSKPRDIFGELKTEDFYVSGKRAEKSQKALDKLNEMLNPYGVIVESVLTKDYRFNAAYQKAIEDKKVADQRAEKNKSETKATKEEYIRRLYDAEGEVNKMVAKVDGEFMQAKIGADAYYEKQKMLAQAIESEGIAEAKSIKKMNEALTSSGGITLVKLKIAEALKGKKIIVLPVTQGGLDIKSTDVNKLIDTMGVKSLSSER
jgi:regulator of protease activity HflC (stomatin/prohibitin superfamily)